MLKKSALKKSILLSFASLALYGAVVTNSANAADEQTLSLEGTNWQLVKLTVLGGFVFTPADHGAYVLNFRSENRLTGESDCNSITGAWQQDSTTLRFEPFGATRELCSPGSLHNNLVLYLRDTQTFQLVDGKLFLHTSTAGVEIEFESRD